MIAASMARRSSSATSTRGCAGWRPNAERAVESVDIHSHLQRRRTYPGIFPVLHLDPIYYEGAIEVRRVELPRTRKALMASDHLPLVANLRLP